MTDVHVHVHAGPQVSTLTKTTLAAEEVAHECGCPHRHTPDDKTVRPCEAKEVTAPVIYEAASRTYAQARADIIAHLQKQGWTVKPSLKIPHATDPTGEIRLWFKPQAIWYTAEGRHDFKNARSLWIDDIRKMTPEQFEAEVLRHLKHRGVAEMPGPLASAAGAAMGSITAAALAAEETSQPCAPFTRVVNDEEKFKVCLARQRKIGPLKNEKTVYELIRHDMASRTTECFIVVGTDIHGELRVYSEVARGEIDRVAVDPADIMQRVLGTCSGFFAAHNHPSSKVRPSKADLDLTEAITDATRPFPKLVFLDHLVCGADSFYSIRAHHPKLFKK